MDIHVATEIGAWVFFGMVGLGIGISSGIKYFGRCLIRVAKIWSMTQGDTKYTFTRSDDNNHP